MANQNLDMKVIGTLSAFLALDSILIPLLTDGRTALHEWVGYPWASDYSILGKITLLNAERALSGTGALYLALRQYLPK